MRRPFREYTDEDVRVGHFFTSRPPGGVLVPSPVAHVLGVKARNHRRLHAVKDVARVCVALGLLALLFVHIQPAMALSPPPVPSSEEICGSSILDGPSSPPGGAVTVPAGDNSGVTWNTPDTTYWLAPGTHTLGSGMFSQIGVGQGSTYIGAPGAILDGQGLNHSAFVGSPTTSGVTIEYLTIQNFDPPGSQGAVNGNASPGWTEEYNTMQDILPGAATMAGTDAVIDDNCLTENGEYGFNAYTANDDSALTGGASNVTIDNNEISYNDTCNWENVTPFPITPPAGCTGAGQYSGCGCSGGGKFWANDTGQFDDNYVHDNYATGAWWDTDDTGYQIQGNYFSGNWGSGIIYEISYNALITGNTFADNGWGAGPYNPGFPTSAVYISESGSDSRVAGPYGSTFDITGNGFYDNWGGVVLWENSNRFCGQLSPTNDHSCTLDNPQWSFSNLSVCGNQQPVPPSRAVASPAPPSRQSQGRGGTVQGQDFTYLIFRQPYYSDCRWKTQNVAISGNLFDFTASNIPSCTTANYCGFNGLFSEVGIYPPYTGNAVPDAITFSQNDLFSSNTYCGPWMFAPYHDGNQASYATWQASPYNQDPGSTLNSAACTPSPPGSPVVIRPGPVNRPVTIPVRAGGGSR